MVRGEGEFLVAADVLVDEPAGDSVVEVGSGIADVEGDGFGFVEGIVEEAGAVTWRGEVVGNVQIPGDDARDIGRVVEGTEEANAGAHVEGDVVGGAAELFLFDPVLGGRSLGTVVFAADGVAGGVGLGCVVRRAGVGQRADAFVGEKITDAVRKRVAPVFVILVFPVEVDAEKVAATIGSVEGVTGRRTGDALIVTNRRQQPTGGLVAAHGKGVKAAFARFAPDGAIESVAGDAARFHAGGDAPRHDLSFREVGGERGVVAEPDIEHALHIEVTVVLGVQAGQNEGTHFMGHFIAARVRQPPRDGFLGLRRGIRGWVFWYRRHRVPRRTRRRCQRWNQCGAAAQPICRHDIDSLGRG